MSAGWQQHGDEWIFEIQADAFLYRMVRRLVYAQVAVGQARLSAKTLLQALDDRPRFGRKPAARSLQVLPRQAA